MPNIVASDFFDWYALRPGLLRVWVFHSILIMYLQMQLCTYIDLSFGSIDVYTKRTKIRSVQKGRNPSTDTALCYQKHTYIVTLPQRSSVGCLSELPLQFLGSRKVCAVWQLGQGVLLGHGFCWGMGSAS